jgi:spore coat protein H
LLLISVLVGLVADGRISCPRVLGQSTEALSRSDPAEADALFTEGALHVLRIDIPRQGMQSLRRDPRSYVKATLREGPISFSNVLVRLKGGAGSFRDLADKPGLTINLKESNRAFHGLRSFHLNNSVQDDTYLSEWTCSQVFREAGVPAGRVAHAVVELNGRRLGLYVLLESINSDFLEQYFKKTHGNLYSLSANADINAQLEKMGGREETHGAELRALAAAARESDLERLRARLPRALDMPRFLSFMAVEVMLDHWDGYTFNIKNYVVYHDPMTDRMIFMPHDLDQVLRDVSTPIIPAAHGMVARAVLRDPETRAHYVERFREVFTNSFVVSILTRRIDERVAKLAPALRKYDPDMAQQFANNAADLKGRFARRARVLAVKLKGNRPGD